MDDGEQLVPGLPHRRVTDPEVMRAMAHPLRWKLYETLAVHGSATATKLADLVGDTQANCSWHLRQLHRYGFVEPAAGGKGRQRPWQLVRQTTDFDLSQTGDSTSTEGIAATALSDILLEREVAALRHRQAVIRDDAPEWDDASMKTQTLGWLTADELAAFTAELKDVARRHIIDRLDRFDPDKRPEDCRPVRYVAWAFPAETSTD